MQIYYYMYALYENYNYIRKSFLIYVRRFYFNRALIFVLIRNETISQIQSIQLLL